MKNNNSCFFKFLSLFLFIALIFVSVSSGYIDRLTYKVNIKQRLLLHQIRISLGKTA